MDNTKWNWFSSYAGEQIGNQGGRQQFRYNNSHLLLIDWDVSSLPAYSDIAGVQVGMYPADITFNGLTNVFYNDVVGANSWSQGTGQACNVQAAGGEPNYLYAACPGTAWKSGTANLKTLVMSGAAPLISDASNLDPSIFQVVFDLDPSAIQDFLQGNSQGLCIWGSDSNFIVNAGPAMFYLYVYSQVSGVKSVEAADLRRFAVTASPNPANLMTSILYPENASPVRISVYNLNGKLVRSLSAAHGRAVWNGADNQGRFITSGTYLYRVSSGNMGIKTGRVIINR